MKQIYVERFKKNVQIITIGEYYATDREEGIATLLGSCVSACIYEENGGIGGMNHFLLPGAFNDEEIFLSPVARYGMFAMELLMGELIKLKVDRNKLRAKIFGGAEIMPKMSGGIGRINVNFVKTFLQMEGIPILGSDVGGYQPRKIYFFPRTGKVMVKKIVRDMGSILNMEDKYLEQVRMEI